MQLRSFTIFFISLVALLWIPLQVNASAISPATIELSGKRSEVLESSFTLINTSAAEQTFYLGTMKFISREDGGKAEFIRGDTSGFPEWISFPVRTVRVPENSKVEVPFKVSLPEDSSSGGHYAAIVISEAPYDLVASNGVSVNAKIAILLFLTVEGETQEKVELLEFESGVQGRVRSSASGDFSYRLQNQGNVHVVPTGLVTIKDMFGRVVVKIDANESKGRLLPGSTRRYEGVFGEQEANGFLASAKAQIEHFAIGPVTAELTLAYGASGAEIIDSFSFWVIPWQLFITIAVVIALVLLLLKLSGRTRKQT